MATKVITITKALGCSIEDLDILFKLNIKSKMDNLIVMLESDYNHNIENAKSLAANITNLNDRQLESIKNSIELEIQNRTKAKRIKELHLDITNIFAELTTLGIKNMYQLEAELVFE